MLTTGSRLTAHLVALTVVAIWGSTFVFTKLLLNNGISPAQIFTLRFIIAYIMLLILEMVNARRKGTRLTLLSRSWREELIMAALGLTGGSLYFLSENAAMLHTTATNTSLIVCTCPLVTMLVFRLFYRTERITRRQLAGSLTACLGMATVVLNGHFVLHLSPLGDLLAFTACVCWAFYSLMMRLVTYDYSTVFITRKVFFYGLVTILPYYIVYPGMPAIAIILQPRILANLLFLSCVASLICFMAWNWVIRQLGAVSATNWVYFNPITTIIFAWWILSEQITPFFIIGTVLILAGMYWADSKSRT